MGLVKWVVEQKDVNTGQLVALYEYDDLKEATDVYESLSRNPNVLTSLHKQQKKLLTENM
jgi:phage terminase large subunit-like protein